MGQWHYTPGMAFLRFKRTGKGTHRYAYIVESRRSGKQVHSKIIQYLGREDALTPAGLRRALTYWRVKPKGAKRKAK